MILTDYYLFKRRGGSGRFRFDYVRGTNTYKPLEQLTNKKGELFLYIGENIYTHDKKADEIAVSNKKAISKIKYCRCGDKILGYGDWVGTDDVLIFVFYGDYTGGKFTDETQAEIFIARGQKKFIKRVIFEFSRGVYNEEITNIRKHVIIPQRTLFDV